MPKESSEIPDKKTGSGQMQQGVSLHTDDFAAWLDKYFKINDEPHYRAKHDSKIHSLSALAKTYERAFFEKPFKAN